MVRKAIIEQLHIFKESINKDFPVDTMLLFGSQAWGRPREDSDVDLIIVSSRFRKQRSLDRGIGLYKYWKIDLPVDFICVSPEEFVKARKEPTLIREAVERGVVI